MHVRLRIELLQGWSQGGGHRRPSSTSCARNDAVANTVLFPDDAVGAGAPGPGAYHIPDSLSTRKVEHQHQTESAAFRQPLAPKLKARVQQAPASPSGASPQGLRNISVGADAADVQHSRCATADAIIKQHAQNCTSNAPFNSHVCFHL